MDRHIRLDTIAEKLEALCRQDGPVSGQAAQVLSEAVDELHAFQRENLDFHEIVEHVDHSIFVTDGEGNVLYVNPAYSQNTNVQPEDVLGRNVFDIVQEGRIFTGGASCDVIQNRKRVFRLSTTYKTDPPLMGYTVGVPVFNRDGSLSKVVVSSRPLSTLKLLQGDFEQFLHNLEEIRKREPVSSVNENSSTLEARPMIGHSKALNGIWEKIRHVAASDATVLITGESGVGKEVVADEVYRHSLRNNRPYIKVNCAAIPASLLESELFGYDKGAFSGASAGGKAGLFELADGGTLLLDEIGDLPPGSPGQAAARHPEPGDHPGWQYQGKASGHPFSLPDQQQPAGKGRRRDLPQRPFLPAQRYSHPDPPAESAPRGYSRTGGTLLGNLPQEISAVHHAHAQVNGHSHTLSLARQCAGAGKRIGVSGAVLSRGRCGTGERCSGSAAAGHCRRGVAAGIYPGRCRFTL